MQKPYATRSDKADGRKAFLAGKYRYDCPHLHGSVAEWHWLKGFDEEQKQQNEITAADEAEAVFKEFLRVAP